jgi:septum formation protein
MLYLASSSPRRAELLAQIGVKFDIIHVDIDESALAGEGVDSQVRRLSREKALAGCATLDMQPGDLVLAADTLIALDGKDIGKPQSGLHCETILARLSGRQHTVYSGVALADHSGRVDDRLSANEIQFRTLSTEEIHQYCESGEPMDKAGAYAIQGMAAIFIQHLKGSYSAVMGLALFETAQLLQQAGYKVSGNSVSYDE